MPKTLKQHLRAGADVLLHVAFGDAVLRISIILFKQGNGLSHLRVIHAVDFAIVELQRRKCRLKIFHGAAAIALAQCYARAGRGIFPLGLRQRFLARQTVRILADGLLEGFDSFNGFQIVYATGRAIHVSQLDHQLLHALEGFALRQEILSIVQGNRLAIVNS